MASERTVTQSATRKNEGREDGEPEGDGNHGVTQCQAREEGWLKPPQVRGVLGVYGGKGRRLTENMLAKELRRRGENAKD
jgi:hypothetical protein